MKVLSLRYGENFAPPCGTMSAHKSLISTYGFVWYGKFGCPISKKVVTQVMNEKPAEHRKDTGQKLRQSLVNAPRKDLFLNIIGIWLVK